MKVFYSTSVSRSTAVLPLSRDIAHFIEELGCEIVNKFMLEPEYIADPNWDKELNGASIYEQELQRMLSADVLVTECTTPSFGAAFFIDKCLEVGKPILSLHYGYFENNAPLMLRGRSGINLQMYTEENIKAVLQNFFVGFHQLPQKNLRQRNQKISN